MLFLAIALIALGSALFYLLARPVLFGAPYFNTKQEGIAAMLRFLDIKPGIKCADLGSGAGNILLALAEKGCEAHGYEINPLLVFLSRRRIRRVGFEKRAFVHWRSFWRADFSDFDALSVYGIPRIMPRLEKKLVRELRPGTKVASNMYNFPGWKPVAKENHVRLYIKD